MIIEFKSLLFFIIVTDSYYKLFDFIITQKIYLASYLLTFILSYPHQSYKLIAQAKPT